jgi:multimeric flavodoxin WrbA
MIRKIVILNGNPDPDKFRLTVFLAELEERLVSSGLSVITHFLSEKKIKSCLGCWDCWLKTPGICRQKDDAEQVLKDAINADLVVYASPLIMGMYSALLKNFQDRMIPLIHPYIEIENGESRHRKRYPNYPGAAVILERNDATLSEIENIKIIFQKMFKNFHGGIEVFEFIEETNPKEISYAISNI